MEIDLDNMDLFNKLKNNSIDNKELILGLNSDKHNILGLTILEIIERKYCNGQIIFKLAQLGTLLKNHRLVGLYHVGHIAIAALFLISNKKAEFKYHEIYNSLSEEDKYIKRNIIDVWKKQK